MKIGFLILVLGLLSACTVMQPILSSEESLPEGEWQGKITWNSVMQDQSGSAGATEVSLGICAKKIEIRYRLNDGSYILNRSNVSANSAMGTHTLQFRDAAAQQPGWIENQIFTIIKLTDKSARVQWSRAVSNRDLLVTDKNRTFLESGNGFLERMPITCSAP